MRRRWRPSRDKIAFSFDSFLDVVANVIGIIIKLILVTWVGARSYTAAVAILEQTPEPAVASAAIPAPSITDDPLHGKVQQNLTELDNARARLLAELGRLADVEKQGTAAQQSLLQVAKERRETEQQKHVLESLLSDEAKKFQLTSLSLAELQKRGQDLIAQLKELDKSPSQRRVLRYHTPVSRQVRGDELFFECKGGKITFIDLPAFLHEVQGSVDGVVVELRTRSKIERTTSQVGAFRLRHVFEKEEALGGSIRYSLTGWELEPAVAERGETLEAALAAGSEFRRLTDALDANQTVVTFWVYPDSFELFRRLRDQLYERDIEVAARPLPPGGIIAGSRNGTKSRGQ